MTVDYNWSEDILDLEDYQELRAFQKGQLDAIRRARQFNTEFIIMRDGKVTELGPGETHDIEARGLKRLEELNQIIARLQSAAQTTVP